MANQIAAPILKNLVMQFLGCKARNISFGDVIAPNWKGASSTGLSYCDCTDQGDLLVVSWSPVNGFKHINCVDNTHMYNGNHDSSETLGLPLYECCDGTELFIIVGNGKDSDLHYTIYKTPNFKEYWNKVELEDIKRWEEFLNV